jgi:hypothetical protein
MRAAMALAAVLALAPPALASGDAAQAWAGTWRIDREDPRIRTRGGAETLQVQLVRGRGGQVVLRWSAHRGICEDPMAGPCEWIGARGEAGAVVAGPRALAAVLRISADSEDSFLLVLERGAAGRATGRLVSEKGGVAYRLDAERE